MKNVLYLIAFLFVQACSNQNNILESGGEALSQTIDNLWIQNPTDDSLIDSENIEEVATIQPSTTKNPKPLVKKLSSIEIIWLFPEHKVSNYILRYGTSEDNLDSVVEFPVEELKIIDHPEHGKVYQYILKEIPAGASIYYTLQAKNILGLSDPTPIAVEKSNTQ